MRRPMVVARPGGALLGVLLLLSGGAVAAAATDPPQAPRVRAETPQPRTEVPLARATLACPDAAVGTDTATSVAVAAPGPLGDAPAGGMVTVVGPSGSLDATTEAPGSARVENVAEAGRVVVRARGAAAPGLAAAQVTRSANATMRGLAGVSCTASVADAWFVGSGAEVGRRGRVYLTNTEAAPAVVDVGLYGPDGPIDTPDARGVTIPPGGQEVRLLDALAPGVGRFGIHVRARQGRVSAAVRDLEVDGLTPLGADWVPASVAPSPRVVVAGVPGGAGERLLQVLVPGEADGIVRLRFLGPAGEFTPPGLDVIEARAGSVTEVDLSAVTAGEPVSVELRADVPVTASVLSRLTGETGQLSDFAYAAAAAPLTPRTPGVVAEVRQGTAVASRLLLTAPRGDARVRLAPVPPATGPGTTVDVDARSLLVVDLTTVSADPAYALRVAPEPGSGPVLAVRQIAEADARGPMVTSSPVEPGRYVVPVPRVVPDLSAGLRSG